MLLLTEMLLVLANVPRPAARMSEEVPKSFTGASKVRVSPAVTTVIVRAPVKFNSVAASMMCVPKVSIKVELVPTKFNVLGKVLVMVYVTAGLRALSLKTSELIDALAVKLTVPAPILNKAMSVLVMGVFPGHVLQPVPTTPQFPAFQFPDPPFQVYVQTA